MCVCTCIVRDFESGGCRWGFNSVGRVRLFATDWVYLVPMMPFGNGGVVFPCRSTNANFSYLILAR